MPSPHSSSCQLHFQVPFMQHPSCPPSPPSALMSASALIYVRVPQHPLSTYQSLHRPMQRMPMVPPELGIGTVERGIAVRLWLFNANHRKTGQPRDHDHGYLTFRQSELRLERTDPLRCAFLLWLCCEEFFDSVKRSLALRGSAGWEKGGAHWPSRR